MVLFIGVTFHSDRVDAIAVDRNARTVESATVALGGRRPGPARGILEVPPGEWARAGALALQDVYRAVPVKFRKLWGIALAGPPGWIAIDPDFDAVSELRLTPGASPLEDLRRWLAEHPRERRHLFQVLSPKDYFRFLISGGLAIDATQAEQFGLLERGRRRWSDAALQAERFSPSWWPPVFDSAVATGRLSEAGIGRTGIPGGVWLVGGADRLAARAVAASDPRRRELVATLDDGDVELRFPLAETEGGGIPDAGGLEGTGEGAWRLEFSALNGWFSLRRRASIDGGPEAAAALAGCIERARGELAPLAGGEAPAVVVDAPAPAPDWLQSWLDAAGEACRPARFLGRPDPGPALLAGLAKPLFHGIDGLYRKYDPREARQEPAAIEEETAGPAGSEDEKGEEG
jgi:hypothetical protein